MTLLPPEVRAGYVYNRVLRAIGDRPEDEDRFPDGIPAKGTVTFTPKNSVKQVVSNNTGVTVTREPVVCTIHQGEDNPNLAGLLIDEAGAVGGVWLVVGEWTVSYQFEDRYSNVPNQDIVVTEDHTEENPLDVALVAGITPSPTIKFVVNEQIYVDSKKARDEALEFRNEAQEAFEKFTWPVEVSTTPPENTNVIWVNPDEPAGTASDWALRAEDAAARSEALGITVDTTVGTRVFVGDTMIYGDTGWRAICRWSGGEVTEGELPQGIGPVGVTTGGVFIKRELSTVTVALVEAVATLQNPQINLPVGWRGSTTMPFPATPIFYRQGSNPHLANAEFGGSFVRYRGVPEGGILASVGSGGYGVMASAPAQSQWPSSLPGTPA